MDGQVLTKETKKLIVVIGDDLIKGDMITKNKLLAGLIELGDGPILNVVIEFIDAQGDKVIPDELDAKINEACNLAIKGQFEEAAGVAGEVIDQLVDLEKVDDSIEHLVFVDGLKFMVRNIQLYIEKNKAAALPEESTTD